MSLYCSTTNGLLIDATVAITLHFLTVSENPDLCIFGEFPCNGRFRVGIMVLDFLSFKTITD